MVHEERDICETEVVSQPAKGKVRAKKEGNNGRGGGGCIFVPGAQCHCILFVTLDHISKKRVGGCIDGNWCSQGCQCLGIYCACSLGLPYIFRLLKYCVPGA